jgi:GntR family transcriptional repressor for pyruvate dehydrogenase complex
MMGVVSQRVGDGTYLNGEASSVLAEPMEFLFLLDETSSQDLVETRLMVEPTLAAKAAELASREQILVLRQTIAEPVGGRRTSAQEHRQKILPGSGLL